MDYNTSVLSNRLNDIGLSAMMFDIIGRTKRNISSIPNIREYTEEQLQSMFNLYSGYEIDHLIRIAGVQEEKRKIMKTAKAYRQGIKTYIRDKRL